MIFDLKNIADTKTEQNVLLSSGIEESYTNSVLLYLSESKRELRDYTKSLYEGILESGEDYGVITESFSDFFTKVKELIAKFLKYIKSLFDRFITSLNKFIRSEKYLIKHKAEFTKFGASHEFDFNGYEFSFSDHIPSIEVEAEFNKDFVELDFDDILQDSDSSKIVAKISAQHAKLVNSLKNGRYDEFRQQVISADTDIDSSDFANELFRTYRSGENEKDEITINSSRVLESLGRIQTSKSIETSIKKTKDKIDREYTNVQKSIQNMIYRNKDNDVNKLLAVEIKGDYNGTGSTPIQLSSEAMSKIDLFIKAKVGEVMELSTIHALAFSYKLDAISDCYKQDKDILYRALNKIQRDLKV